MALIAGSIREYGFTNPVLVDGENGIIAGHGRVLAARKLGLASVPVIELGAPQRGQKRAYVLADNRLAEQAGWDKELLALEAADLSELGVDLASLGFEAAEIDALLERRRRRPARGGDARAAGGAGLAPGDLWLLGRHRLLCGSATDPADVARLLGGVRPHLMATDPPYGVSYDPAWRNRAGASATKRTGKVLNDDRADWREAWALFPGEVAYVWHGALHATTVAESLDACGFAIRSQIIWAKERLVLSPRRLPLAARALLVRGAREGQGRTGTATASRRRSGQIPSRDQDAATVHGTQKPVEAMRRPMLNNSSPGPAGLRAVLRIGDLDHRRRDLRPDQPLDGARPGLRRCGGRRAGRPSPARPRPSTATAAASPRSPPSGATP